MKLSLPLHAILLIGAASLPAVGQIYAEKHEDANPLSRRIVWTSPQQTYPITVLRSYLSVTHLPGGIFVVKNCSSTEPLITPSEKSTLRDGLNQLVKLMPEYTWSIENGVINFLPRSHSPSPLDIRIAEFKVEKTSPLDASNLLFESEEVKSGLTRLGLHLPSVELVTGGGSPVKDERRVTLNEKNATLREALNAIVKADGSKTWILSVYSCNGEKTYQRVLVN